MKIVVLGAGLAGVTAAWYLSRAGHQVTVLDRQPRPAEETSFANGGQISVSHPEPWANPGAPWQALRSLGRENAPLLFRFRADMAQWKFALRFLSECRASRTRSNTNAIANLAVYSRERLRELRAATGIEYDCREKGILHLFFNGRSLAHAAKKAEGLFQDHGIRLELLDRDGCMAVEPALATYQGPLAGGLFAPDDESGDAYQFVTQLTGLCQAAGVQFQFGTRIEKLEAFGKRIAGVHVREISGLRGRINADAFVLAAGSFSPKLASSVGIDLPIYPVKGYSVTVPLDPGALAPFVSITDESRRIVMSRLGDRLRVAGTAELVGFDKTISRVRCEAIQARARELFPEAVGTAKGEFWAGLRPATAGGVPFIGRSRYQNLYFNTGHGTLGWTLACGSARALVDIVEGGEPEIEFPFLLGLPDSD